MCKNFRPLKMRLKSSKITTKRTLPPKLKLKRIREKW
jgi:hypothetical protein